MATYTIFNPKPPAIPIIGKPEFGPYPINMFYSQAAHKELNLPGLMGTPGLKGGVDTSHAHGVRGLHVMGDYLYAVIGNRVYEIDTSFAETQLTGLLTTTTGPVLMENDGTNLMIVDPDVGGYTYTLGGNVTVIADGDFPPPSSLTWQDGYFIVTERDTGTFYISTAYDPTAWDPLDFTTAEGTPDDALSIYMDHRELWVFGTNTIEVYYNSGNADFPFERRQGAFIQQGLGARDSVADGDNTIFFLDRFGRVIRVSGYKPQVISSRDIENEIAGLTSFADAIGFYYTQEGHGFYVLTFPTGDITWAFDVTTQQWHKRRSYPINLDGTEGRWRANCYAFFDGKHVVGDWQYGQLSELDFETYTDKTETIRRFVDFPAIGNGKDRIRHNKLEVQFEGGVGLVGGDDPQAGLRWSDDGGKTWSNQVWTGMGKIGEYSNRAIWRRLGASERRIYRVSVTDPVKVVITGAHLN